MSNDCTDLVEAQRNVEQSQQNAARLTNPREELQAIGFARCDAQWTNVLKGMS
jgi:hypothetical protein